MKSILKQLILFGFKTIVLPFFLLFSISFCYSQDKVTTLKADTIYEQALLKNQTNKYKIKLRKGDFCSLVVMQMGVDVVVDVSGTSSKKIVSFDTTNGNYGAEYIKFTADKDGTYSFKIYPLNDYTGMTESEKNIYIEQNQGKYEIRYVSVIRKEDYIQYNSKKQKFMEDLNLGFEKTTPGKNMPDNWDQDKTSTNVTVSNEKHGGNNSVLLERDNSDEPVKYVWKTIPAVFEGNMIEVRAFMKMKNVSDGKVDLAIRLDGVDDMISMKSMLRDNIQGTSDWKQYSIWLPYSNDVRKINFGSVLYGTGQLWVDDFQILIDGVDIDELKYIEPKKYKAESDTEFDNGSGISSIDLTETTIDNLTILGKVWGFLKYYHPAIATGDYNWDYELFRIMPAILAAHTTEKRNEVLSDWITSLGKLDTDKMIESVKGEITLYPDLSLIDNLELGEKLAGQLTAIKDTKRDDENYYIGMAFAGNPLFRNERSYRSMNFPDEGFMLLALFRYWNMIQYYFPYRHLIGENWNDVLKEFISEFINARDELEYDLVTLALISRIHDTHAFLDNASAMESYKGSNYAPVRITFVEDKAVVTGYFEQILGEKSGLQIGDVIERINNKTVEEIVKEELSITSASNYPTQLRVIARQLLRTRDSVLTIDYERGSEKFSREIECFTPDKINFYSYYLKSDTCFKLINSEIAYVYPGSIKNEYLPEIMPEVLKTKGLIIDFRSYPSDDIMYSLSEYLQPDSVSFVKPTFCSIKTPGLFTIGDCFKVGHKNENYYKGKVVIIINETTQSSAEFTTMAFRTAPDATVIGSTTAGADGNVSEFCLPGRLRTGFSGLGVLYPDGKETQRIGIVPDIEVKPTIKGIAEGRDELLEKAIEIINGE